MCGRLVSTVITLSLLKKKLLVISIRGLDPEGYSRNSGGCGLALTLECQYPLRTRLLEWTVGIQNTQYGDATDFSENILHLCSVSQ